VPLKVGTPTQTLTPTLGAPTCPPRRDALVVISAPAEDTKGPPSRAMEPQIHTFLDSRGSAQHLEQALSMLRFNLQGAVWETKAQVYESDVTGDDVPEVIIGLIFSSDEFEFSDGLLWVYSCSDGAYQKILEEYLGSIQFSEDDGVREVVDMNQNGLAEIVYSVIDNIGAHGYFTRPFYILEWDGDQFVPLIEQPAFYDPLTMVTYATVYNGDGEVLDTDGDGTLELVLSNGLAGHYGGPQRRRTDVFAWNGETYSLVRWEYEPPTYRFQAVQDGDDLTRFGEYERALASYQMAIFDEDLFGWQAGYFLDLYAPTPPVPDPEERPVLEAYSRYRIVLVHAALENMSAAQTVHDTLLSKFPSGSLGHPYAKMAAVFWSEFTLNEDMSSACDKVVEYASANEDAILVIGPLGPGFYGEQSFYYTPADLCPFTEP
jgi:hypothetical protein